jgi:Threonine dehydrogenase and related Zn-dependent dehydrogenases
MKALVLTDYNKFEYIDVADPQLGPDDVLIRVAACGICGSDVHGMDGSSGRRVPPVIMGHEAAGVIQDTGRLVGDWHPGDRVTFDSTIYCGDCYFCRHQLVNLCDRRRVLGVSHDEYRQDGAMAEYVAVPSRILYSVPDGVSFVDATIVEPLSIAVHAVSVAAVGSDTDVAVIGCGVIGLLLIQVLKARGCRQILAVDVNPYRLDRASGMGATTTLRSDEDDVVFEIATLTSGRGADVSFEAVGINATVGLAVAVVRKGGTVVLVGNIAGTVDLPLQKVVTRQLTLHGSAASSGEYPEAIGLIAGGAVAANAIVTAVAPLRDGPSWFARLQRGEESLLKVVLEP